MSGHRDDGTFAEDKAHHPNRKVSRVTHSQDTDVAPAHGIPRPQTSDFTSGPVVDGPNDYDLGPVDREDLREQSELINERLEKGYY